jgi:hypothetical protein
LKPATAQPAEAASEQTPKAAPEQTPKVTAEQTSKVAPERTTTVVAERQTNAVPEPQTRLAVEQPARSTPEQPAKSAPEQPVKSAPEQSVRSAQPGQGAAAQPLKEQSPKEQKQLAEERKATLDGPNEPEAANTVGDAASLLRRLFFSRFSYKTTSAGAGASPVTSEVNVNLEPLSFDGCSLAWRDQNDTLSVSLADLNPESVTVGPRARPGTTFSKEVWDVGLNATGGAGAFTETKGDGSGAVNQYNGLDLQYDSREKADRVAGLLRQAIRLCGGKP